MTLPQPSRHMTTTCPTARMHKSPGTNTQHPPWTRNHRSPPQFEHNVHGRTGDPDSHTASLKYHNDEAGIAPPEPDHDLMIELPAHEQIASGNGGRSWAEEMEIGNGLSLQGEYRPTTYPPPPGPPSPTSWYPPPPSTLDYTHPRTQYRPPLVILHSTYLVFCCLS
jgi:hypothetical protein